MPLPPVLAARLAKRGIIKGIPNEPEEEIIAEDYDHVDDLAKSFVPDHSHILQKIIKGDNNLIKEASPSCPNKWNVFHYCTDFCWTYWGRGCDPDPETERRRRCMLKKYPLPEAWKEIFDAGSGRHYYWNTDTDQVSWLPPGHPRAKITCTAVKLREQIKKDLQESKKDRIYSELNMQMNSDEESDYKQEWRERERRDWSICKEKRERTEEISRNSRLRRKDNDLDPMDPASYSDTPRGTWSSGLMKENEAKTGVDVTASGPLYQMRPYPSPGAVLKANALLNQNRKN